MGEQNDKTPVDKLLAENKALTARITELEAAAKQHATDEEIIREKMGRGLSREQALQVITRQREFDVAKKAAKPGKK